jgi:hypothetical protein
MSDPLIEIDYLHLPDQQVIKEIVRLAELDEPDSLRKFSRLAVYYLEDCKEQKKGDAMDEMLVAILDIQSNFSRISSILRSCYSERNALKHWYTTRDKAIDILREKLPERADKLMRGLHEEDPHQPEEMEGLSMMESLVKTMHKYS